jgi:PKD repeat protein
MDGDATIQPPPVVFNILPSGDTCAPAIVRLNGSQIGISYRLIFNNTVYLDSLYGTGQPLVFGAFQTAGIYKIIAIDTLTHCEYWMADSLRIFAAPIKYNIIPNGIACANSIVGLDGSQSGVSYTLFRDGWIIAAGPIAGTGNAISFGVQTVAGTYTVEGVVGTTSCHSVMNGSAILYPLPLLYQIQPHGNQCAGTEIYLNGSQLGVTYELLRDNIVQLPTMQGTGAILHFGPQYLPGVYTVKAINNLSTCDTLMGGSTTILPVPLAFSVTPAGVNCSPTTIGLSGSEPGLMYQLRRDSLTNVGLPLPGTGFALDYGPQNLPGVYRVVCYNPSTDCYFWMTGNVTIQTPPLVYSILPSGDTCAPAMIRLNGSQVGKLYRLVLNGTIYLDNMMGTGLPLVFGTYLTSGVYRIMGVDTLTDCEYPMADSVRIFDSPTKYNVIPNGIACVNMAIGLDDSDPGVNYTLILDGVSIAAGPIAGTGGAISFGTQSYPGTYTVEADFTATTCHSFMNGMAVLSPAPVGYLVQPQGNQCPGTDIYLNGSQSGVTYQLIRDNAIQATLPGNGSVIHFGPQYIIGVYTIKAVNTTSNCDTLMSGSANIIPGPLAFNVIPAGANCSPADVGLTGSQAGVEYQLFRNGFAIGLPVPGTGFALSFGLQTDGSYIVIAKILSSSCTDTMPGVVIITPGPVVLSGNDTSICQTHSIQLLGHASDYSTVTWFTMGDGMFSDPAILNPVYTPGVIDISSGQVRLALTVHGSPACLHMIVSDTMTLSVNPFPVVDAGANDTICATQAATLNGIAQHVSSMHWTTLGDGSFDNANVLNPVYTPGIQDKITGNVLLKLVVHGTMTCQADTAYDFLTVYIQPLPVADAGTDDTICENWTYRLSGIARHQSSVTWTTLGDGSFDDPALVDATYSAGTNDRIVGSVRLILTSNGIAHCSAETDQDTMKLILNKLPVLEAGADSIICSNQVYQLNALAQRNSDLEWITSGDGGFDNIHTLNPVYTPGASDILTGSVMLKLTAHGLLNCITEMAADSLQLDLHPMPVANAGNDTLSCPNIAIPLHGSATHFMSVLWNTMGDGSFDDPSVMQANYIPGLLDNQQGFTTLFMTVNGEQQCASMVDTDTVRIDFKPLPSVSLSGTGIICEDSTGVVSITLAGLGPWTIVYTDGQNSFTIGNIPASPYLLSVNPIVTTTYTILSVADANCTVNHTGPAFTVTVKPRPNIYAMTSTNGGGYCEGGIGVEIGIDGSQTGIFYQLLLGGLPSGFAMPGTGLPITFGWKTTPGIYQVKAWHPQTLCEALYPDSVVALVFPAPSVDFLSDSACFGQPTQFHLTGMDINRIASWQWNFGDGIVATYNSPIEPAHIYPATGNYLVSLIVTDTNDCIRTFVHPVSVSELPIALFSNDAPMCSGYTVNFSNHSYAPGNNYLYLWRWEFGDGTDITISWPNLPDVSHVYDLPGTYPVKLTVTTNRGCSASMTRMVIITPSPASNFDYTNACENEHVHFNDISQLNGGGSVVEWRWNFGDPMSGVNNTATTASPIHIFSAIDNYEVRLIVMNSGGCIDTIKKTVTVAAGPRPDFTFNTACHGSVTQFTDASVPNSNIEWLWDFGDGGPGSASQNPAHIYDNPGVYEVKLTVKNSNLCSHDTTINVSVIPLPTAAFETNAPMCHGSPVTFTNTSVTQHGQIVKWVWDFGDGTDTTILFPAIPDVTHTFTGTASQHLVRLTVKTSDSCSSYVEYLINSVSGPVASFDHSAILCPGQNVSFTDYSQLNGGGPIISWYWNFNDPSSGSANISTLQNPVHNFTGPGNFNVKMVIINGGNCKDSIVDQVVINALPVSAFTFDTVCHGTVTHFTDQSTSNPGAITNWDWDFGDGQPHANVPNPEHLYVTEGPFDVSLTVMNSNNCTNTKIRVVHISPEPLAAFYNSSVNCSGSDVSFVDQSTASHGYILQWVWTFGDGTDTTINFPGMSPVNHIYATGGDYNVTLTVKTSDSCTASITNLVTVYNQPLANFSFSTANCQETPVQFTDLSQSNGSGAINSWNWDFGDPGSGTNNQSTQQNPVHSFAGAGPFDVRLIIGNANQCYDTIVKTLTVSANPVAAFMADTVCQGMLMHFTDASSSASGTIDSWLWDFGDGTSSGTSQNPTHLYATPGLFAVTLTVVTDIGCQHSVSGQVWVKSTPIAMFTTSDHCQGSLTHFTDQSSTVTGSISSWAWDFGDGNSATGQNPAHIFTNAGTYNVRLIATNTNGCPDTVIIPVVIQQRPTAAFSYFSPNCPAGRVTFTDHSTPAGSQVNSWFWTFEPSSFSTAANPTYTYSYPDSNYTVSLIIHDLNGCADTIESTIYVTPGFAFTFNADTNCVGSPTHFQPVNLALGDSLHDLHWTFGESSSGTSNTSTLYQPTHTYAQPGSYIVKLKAYNSDNCSDSVYKEVQVYNLPEPDFVFQSVICSDTVSFQDKSKPGYGTIKSWKWIWGDGTDTTFFPPHKGDTAHKFAVEGTYEVKLIVTNSNGCIDTIVKNVSIACITSTFAQLNSFNCSGDSIEFRDFSSPVNKINSWHWDFGDTKTLDYASHRDTVRHKFDPGTYLVTLTVKTIAGGNTDSAFNRQTIKVNATPVANFARDTVCFGDSTRFIDLAQDNQVPITFREWQFGDGSSKIYMDTIVNPVHKYLRAGVFNNKFIVRNTIGCRDSVIKQVYVHRLPVASFTSSPPCQRYEIEFADGSSKSDTTMMKWWWNFNDPQNPFDTLYTSSVSRRFDSLGVFPVYLKVMDHNGCMDDTLYSDFEIMPSPIAAFTVTENVDGKQGMIRLNNESSDDAKAYRWSFGDGKTSSETNPVVTYFYDTQAYVIELVTWNADLCYDTTSLTYEFLFDNLFVPNAFSPTNLSDVSGCRVFQPKGMNLREYHVTVFDKWGHLVWESNVLTDDGNGMPAESWDGTFNGELMPQDVYMWKISATFKNGKVWEGSDAGKGSTTTMGTVTLIR